MVAVLMLTLAVTSFAAFGFWAGLFALLSLWLVLVAIRYR